MLKKALVVAPLMALALTGCAHQPGTDLAGNAMTTSSPTYAPYSMPSYNYTPPANSDYDDSAPAAQGATQASYGSAATVTVDGSPSGQVTVQAPTTHSVEPGEFGSKPENGRYLVYKVTMEALPSLTETWSVNPLDFYVRSDEGDHYSHAYADFGPGLESGDLNPGERSRGNLTFDVPKSGKFQLVYAPASTALGEWPAV